MIHTQSGDQDSQLYDRDGQVSSQRYYGLHWSLNGSSSSLFQCINSISRALLNEGLLEEAAASENIRLFFNHKVLQADFDNKKLRVKDTVSNQEFQADFDFCIGADGSYSIIQRQMMRVVRMDYQQEYITHEYLELKMPAGRGDNGEPVFLLDPNHLHIWPRHSFMLIALPNKDKTFTCTLFAPSAELDRLNTPDSILTWFKFHFPDAVQLIGEKMLVEDVLTNPRSPLICTKDVRILSTLLDSEGVASTAEESEGASSVDRRLLHVLEHYTENRNQDLLAICDLAMDNFVEMRHSVTTLTYIVRKVVDNLLYSLTSRKMVELSSLRPILSRAPYPVGEPKGWLPLYTMITFRPDISYATAKRKSERQARILDGLGWAGATLIGVAGVWAASLVRQALAQRR
ncbi:hypothetical protein NMY22_g13309 [Coprinellus aureogranulatus]|nr:hypothetical protein NMY22_g13309 [Coprinellus aureogranulatus]